jgi:hypothetical protein
LEESLRPNATLLVCGSGAIIIVAVLIHPWPAAVASVVLGALMIAGADLDARTLLLPDVVTWGAVGCGIIAAAVMPSAVAAFLLRCSFSQRAIPGTSSVGRREFTLHVRGAEAAKVAAAMVFDQTCWSRSTALIFFFRCACCPKLTTDFMFLLIRWYQCGGDHDKAKTFLE